MGSIKNDISASADWIAQALCSSGYTADFTARSLWEIDRFFDDSSQNGAPKPGGLLSQDLGQRIFAIGAYIGEVARRTLGGEWVGDDQDPKVEVTVELHLAGGKRCWPMQRAIKRLKNGEEDGIAVWGSFLGLQVGPRPRRPRRNFFGRFFG
jgi:hypothetical protein